MSFIIILYTSPHDCIQCHTDASSGDIETAMFDAETLVSQAYYCHKVIIIREIATSDVVIDAVIDTCKRQIDWNYPGTVRRYVDTKLHALCHLEK